MTRAVLSASLAFAMISAANAQITPERTYYGVNRAIPMTVAMPSGASGAVEIGLFEQGKADPVEKASAAQGRVDLAGLFPVLWTAAKPRVLYAQLIVGGKQVGAPVVLQPLLSPDYATGAGQQGQIMWSPRSGEGSSGLRAWVNKHVVLETSLGEVEIAMRPDVAPNSVWNFLSLVEGGFYTDIIFHRVVPSLPTGAAFVIQAGDPAGKGSGGPGYNIDLEKSALQHDFGVISMARSGDPNSAGSQFFLCLSREGTAALDGKYTAFGQTVRGAETITAIAAVPLADQASGRPVQPPVIKSAKAIPSPAFGEIPAPAKKPEGGPAR